jgi:hypothetical protein
MVMREGVEVDGGKILDPTVEIPVRCLFWVRTTEVVFRMLQFSDDMYHE